MTAFITENTLLKNNFTALKECLLFNNINEKDLMSLLSCLEPTLVNYDKNQFILNIKENVTNIGIIISGSANIIKEDINGDSSIISKIGPSHLFAETFVCAGIKKSPVSVLSTGKTTVLYINYNNILNPCDNLCFYHNQLIKNLLKIVADKNLLLTNKIHVISKKTIQEKVLSYLFIEKVRRKKSMFDISFNRQEMADYLSVDRSALSRELSNMKKQGIIDYNKQTFKIL